MGGEGLRVEGINYEYEQKICKGEGERRAIARRWALKSPHHRRLPVVAAASFAARPSAPVAILSYPNRT